MGKSSLDCRRDQGRVTCESSLPVFYTLTNKSILAAGGTDAAAWKAELLAAAGARVTVHAPGTCVPKMRELADMAAITLRDTSWKTAD